MAHNMNLSKIILASIFHRQNHLSEQRALYPSLWYNSAKEIQRGVKKTHMINETALTSFFPSSSAVNVQEGIAGEWGSAPLRGAMRK